MHTYVYLLLHFFVHTNPNPNYNNNVIHPLPPRPAAYLSGYYYSHGRAHVSRSYKRI